MCAPVVCLPLYTAPAGEPSVTYSCPLLFQNLSLESPVSDLIILRQRPHRSYACDIQSL